MWAGGLVRAQIIPAVADSEETFISFCPSKCVGHPIPRTASNRHGRRHALESGSMATRSAARGPRAQARAWLYRDDRRNARSGHRRERRDVQRRQQGPAGSVAVPARGSSAVHLRLGARVGPARRVRRRGTSSSCSTRNSRACSRTSRPSTRLPPRCARAIGWNGSACRSRRARCSRRSAPGHIRGRLPTADGRGPRRRHQPRAVESWFGGDEGVIGRTLLHFRLGPHRRRRHGTGVQVPLRRDPGLDLQSDSS